MDLKRLQGNKKGAILPLVAVFIMFVAFGVTALVVDAGMVYAEKKAMVTAADAAALAGAQTLQNTTGVNISKAEQVAKNFAIANGAATASAIVKNIQLDPKDKKMRQVIEVTTQVVKDNYFAKLIGFETTTINSRAVATWGYVQRYDVNSFIPIFTYSSEFDKVSDGDTQYGLHGQFPSSPPNYGFVDVGTGNVSGVLEGQKIVESIASPLDSAAGGHESIPGGITSRLIKAYEDYEDPTSRERYMTGLIPIIDTEQFEIMNGIPDKDDPAAPLISGKNWWDTKLTLPIKYFAYFIVDDVIVKGNTKGVGASLYTSGYNSQSNSAYQTKSQGVEYSSGGAVNINGETVSLYNTGGITPDASIILGRFTGDTVEARIDVVDGDQKFPGNADAATYCKLIE